jgi:Reverse transcriptase (RNA-dependent DNA polymerase)
MALCAEALVAWGLVAAAGSSDPQTHAQALASPHAAQWQAAMHDEYQSLQEHDVFDIVPLPTGRTAIPSMWVFKTKRNSAGDVDRYKARFCAKYGQLQDVDYTQTFAPVAQMSSFRTVLALATHNGWAIQQLDVQTAFLQSPVDEEVYVRQPPGYVQTAQSGEQLVLRLKRSLYGLKQAPRNWHRALAAALSDLGFRSSDAD